jgi:hypothetical protein
MPRFIEKRFHVISGPPSLFARVRQKMSAVSRLTLGIERFAGRAELRAAPLDAVRDFRVDHCELMTADVRADTGKFVKSAWRKPIREHVLNAIRARRT